MFSFGRDNYTIIESNVVYEEMQEKYPDRIMVVINTCVRNMRLCGDIIALLTEEEFSLVEQPESIAPRFGIWLGDMLEEERAANLYGVYV